MTGGPSHAISLPYLRMWHVFLPRQNIFAVLGVYGLRHYNSTLLVEADSPFGRTLDCREQYWARTPAEVARLYSFPDDSSLAYERTRPLFHSASAATHTSAVIQPCIIGEELEGTIWLESHSRAGAFSTTDRLRISQLSTLAALLLRTAPHATILNSDGLAEVWDVLLTTPTQLTADTPENSTPESTPPRTESRHAPALTPREREVLTQVALGLTNSEAACALHVSINTVRSHRRTLMRKLGAHNVVELLDTAERYGMLSNS